MLYGVQKKKKSTCLGKKKDAIVLALRDNVEEVAKWQSVAV